MTNLEHQTFHIGVHDIHVWPTSEDIKVQSRTSHSAPAVGTSSKRTE